MKYQGQSTDELEEPGEFLETFDLLDENDDEQPDRRPLDVKCQDVVYIRG